MKLFKCLKCGKIIVIEKEGAPSTVCCGQDMVEIKENITKELLKCKIIKSW